MGRPPNRAGPPRERPPTTQRDHRADAMSPDGRGLPCAGGRRDVASVDLEGHCDPPAMPPIRVRSTSEEVDTESPNAARVLTAGATLDAPAAAALRRDASALLARSARPLVVDLTAVRTADPAAAAALRDLAYEAGEADIDLRVVRDPAAPEVARTLLDDEALFETYPTLEAALEGATDDLPARGER